MKTKKELKEELNFALRLYGSFSEMPSIVALRACEIVDLLAKMKDEDGDKQPKLKPEEDLFDIIEKDLQKKLIIGNIHAIRDKANNGDEGAGSGSMKTKNKPVSLKKK